MFKDLEIWWLSGTQLLYGEQVLGQVDAHSTEMIAGINASGNVPVKIVYKGTVKSSEEAERLMKEATACDKCAGVITWMHTFSPAKMWIKGLQALQTPTLNVHPLFNAELTRTETETDFMHTK